MAQDKFKVIAFDLDGTLLNKESDLSSYTKQVLALLYEKGVTLVVASGRSFQSLPEVIFELPYFSYAITNNGAEIYQLKDKKKIYQISMKPDVVDKIIAIFVDMPVVLELYSDGVAFVEEKLYQQPELFGITGKRKKYFLSTRKLVKNPQVFVKNHNIEGIGILFKEDNLKEKIWLDLKRDFSSIAITSSIKRLLEISDYAVDKGSALVYLLDHLGFSQMEAMAFGNAYNDITMLERVGKSVAVANACEELKKIADVITRNNDLDGVALYLEKALKKDLL